MIAFFVLLGLIVVVVGWVIGIYNSLVGLRNRVKEALARIIAGRVANPTSACA